MTKEGSGPLYYYGVPLKPHTLLQTALGDKWWYMDRANRDQIWVRKPRAYNWTCMDIAKFPSLRVGKP